MEEAKAQYRRALQVDPKNEEARHNLERFGEQPGLTDSQP